VSAVVKDFTEPMSLCRKDGALYIAETGLNRIVKLQDGKVVCVAGSGKAALTDGRAERAAFSALQGVAVDSDGSVYVADTGNSTVRKIKDGRLYICDTFARKVFVYRLRKENSGKRARVWEGLR